MGTLINRLRHDYPAFTFITGDVAHWSPETKTILFTSGKNRESIWTILHELGHALLDHTDYDSDADLVQKEAAAWDKARELAGAYDVRIHEEYTEGCLDTYRDWLDKRSTCPGCNSRGLQRSKALYQCLNCQSTWKVSEQRFCRPYRLKMAQNIQKAPEH